MTLTFDNGDGTSAITIVNGPAAIAPDCTITFGTDAASGTTGNDMPAPAQLSGYVRIIEWHPIDDTHWRIVFTVSEDALNGETENLMPDKSFSIKYSNAIDALNRNVDKTDCAYADFTIDAVDSAEGLVTTTITLTVADGEISHRAGLFATVVDPICR